MQLKDQSITCSIGAIGDAGRAGQARAGCCGVPAAAVAASAAAVEQTGGAARGGKPAAAAVAAAALAVPSDPAVRSDVGVVVVVVAAAGWRAAVADAGRQLDLVHPLPRHLRCHCPRTRRRDCVLRLQDQRRFKITFSLIRK